MQYSATDVAHEVSNLREQYIEETIDGDYLGSGCYSRAVAYKGVCIKYGGAIQPDPGGRLWAKWCMDHQHLDCVPTMYYFKDFGDDTYIVVMELLRSMRLCDQHIRDSFDVYSDYVAYGDCEDNVDIPEYVQEFVQEFDEIRGCGCMDMHSDNYMLRVSDGSFVVIDPFSNARRQ